MGIVILNFPTIWMTVQAHMQQEIKARSIPYSHSGRCDRLVKFASAEFSVKF